MSVDPTGLDDDSFTALESQITELEDFAVDNAKLLTDRGAGSLRAKKDLEDKKTIITRDVMALKEGTPILLDKTAKYKSSPDYYEGSLYENELKDIANNRSLNNAVEFNESVKSATP